MWGWMRPPARRCPSSARRPAVAWWEGWCNWYPGRWERRAQSQALHTYRVAPCTTAGCEVGGTLYKAMLRVLMKLPLLSFKAMEEDDLRGCEGKGCVIIFATVTGVFLNHLPELTRPPGCCWWDIPGGKRTSRSTSARRCRWWCQWLDRRIGPRRWHWLTGCWKSRRRFRFLERWWSAKFTEGIYYSFITIEWIVEISTGQQQSWQADVTLFISFGDDRENLHIQSMSSETTECIF